MWIWSYLFLALAIVSGVLGFGGVATATTLVAKIAFGASMVLFAVTVFMEIWKARKTFVMEE